MATLPSKGSVKLVSSVLSLNDAVSKGLGFLYQISKHNQHRETKLQVPHYLLLVSSPPAQSPEFCILVTGKCGKEVTLSYIVGELEKKLEKVREVCILEQCRYMEMSWVKVFLCYCSFRCESIKIHPRKTH